MTRAIGTSATKPVQFDVAATASHAMVWSAILSAAPKEKDGNQDNNGNP
jgi:hypothetical protein